MSEIDLQRQIDDLRRQLDYLTSLQDIGASNTYTPTLFNTTNVTASTPEASAYFRVGNVVHVQGRVTIQATAAGAVVMGMSLPIASNLGGLNEAAGVAQAAGQAFDVEIRGDAANDYVNFAYTAVLGSSIAFYYVFTYLVS